MLGEELLTEFITGGTHEESPIGGIPQGIGANGLPNLVEEGETRMEDFIFSNRLKINESLIKKYNLPSNVKGKTFAEASKEINKTFKENLNNKIDFDTSKEMLGRLKKANEELKNKELSDVEEMIDSNDFFLGGSAEAGGTTEGGIQGVGPQAYLGAATTALDLFGDAKGNTSTNTGEAVTSGVLKGASAGMAFGPIGAGVGAGIGAITGIIGSGEAKKERDKEMRIAAQGSHNKINQIYAVGGNMSKGHRAYAYDKGGELQKVSNVNSLTPEGFINPLFSPEITGESLVLPKMEDVNPNLGKSKIDFSKVGDFLSDNSSALRYAPIVANALQLANLDKPVTETRNKIDKRYIPQLVDKEALVNLADENFGNVRESLANISGGDAGSLKANLLGANVQRGKVLSDAMLNADQVNNLEKSRGQQIDFDIDRFNIGQDNLAEEINARNLGNYETQKSKLIGQIGTDVGEIGLEELRKKYPERMGLLYNADGSFNPNGYAALVSLYNSEMKSGKRKK